MKEKKDSYPIQQLTAELFEKIKDKSEANKMFQVLYI
jgi:hypothetical protein